MTTEGAPDDLFDEVTMLEERFFSQGLSSGRESGAASGFSEGRSLGLTRGFDVGQELGFMEGVVRSLRAALSNEELAGKLGKGAGPPSPRLVPTIEKLEQMLREFPRENDKSVDMAYELQRIRAKFLVLKMITGLSSTATPPSSMNDKDSQSF